MKNGLVFGKFCPLHKGHLQLFDFASRNCENVKIAICSTYGEKFSGDMRQYWINAATNKKFSIEIVKYDSKLLPNTSVSSVEVSKVWAEKFKELFPETDVIFTSEKYGDYVAEFMNIKHIMFDEHRKSNPVSASDILSYPFSYWDYIPDVVKPSFTKKISIAGTESTGKSTLTQKLANYFKAEYVSEAGRDVVSVSNECRREDLQLIAELHATEIMKKTLLGNKLLFLDTDLRITKSYSRFLFNEELFVDEWIEKANECDLYIFLEPDCEFIQDGTRLPFEQRNKLHQSHLAQYKNKGLPVVFINGVWDNRFEAAVAVIEKLIQKNKSVV